MSSSLLGGFKSEVQHLFIESLRVQFPAACGEGWLNALSLKSEVHTTWLAAGCLTVRCREAAS